MFFALGLCALHSFSTQPRPLCNSHGSSLWLTSLSHTQCVGRSRHAWAHSPLQKPRRDGQPDKPTHTAMYSLRPSLFPTPLPLSFTQNTPAAPSPCRAHTTHLQRPVVLPAVSSLKQLPNDLQLMEGVCCLRGRTQVRVSVSLLHLATLSSVAKLTPIHPSSATDPT